MTTLVFVENADDELSQQAVVMAGALGAPVSAVAIDAGALGFAPAAWAQTLVDLARERGASAIVAAGNDRGSEVLAHLGAITGEPVAANCISVTPAGPGRWELVRQRWAGSLIEDAELEATLALFTVAADAVPARLGTETAASPVHVLRPDIPAGDLQVRAVESAERGGGVSLATARVVVGGGRGVGGPDGFAPAAWAQTLVDTARERGATAIVAAGSDRGNEVMAHVAAKLDQPMAANCTKIAAGSPASVTRVRWGGSLLEEAQLDGSPLLLTSAAHAVAAEPITDVETIALSDAVSDADRAVRVVDTVAAAAGGVSLADADVVVSGGRGVGSAEGFSVIEELAALLGAAVGCSRAVTSAGWRPHSDQVGQTGTKISPEIYIACGISGATQHMAGCKGAKRLLAVNPDGEASIFSSADYGVIGDLHQVVPAISAEIRKVRGS